MATAHPPPAVVPTVAQQDYMKEALKRYQHEVGVLFNAEETLRHEIMHSDAVINAEKLAARVDDDLFQAHPRMRYLPGVILGLFIGRVFKI